MNRIDTSAVNDKTSRKNMYKFPPLKEHNRPILLSNGRLIDLRGDPEEMIFAKIWWEMSSKYSKMPFSSCFRGFQIYFKLFFYINHRELNVRSETSWATANQIGKAFCIASLVVKGDDGKRSDSTYSDHHPFQWCLRYSTQIRLQGDLQLQGSTRTAKKVVPWFFDAFLGGLPVAFNPHQHQRRVANGPLPKYPQDRYRLLWKSRIWLRDRAHLKVDQSL